MLSINCTFSHAQHKLHVFARLAPSVCFPALWTGSCLAPKKFQLWCVVVFISRFYFIFTTFYFISFFWNIFKQSFPLFRVYTPNKIKPRILIKWQSHLAPHGAGDSAARSTLGNSQPSKNFFVSGFPPRFFHPALFTLMTQA